MDAMATSKLEALAERLRAVRVSLGLSQDEFADALGVSRGYISNIENNKAEPSISFLYSVAAKYPTFNVEFLLFGRHDVLDAEVTRKGYFTDAVEKAAILDHQALTAAIKVSRLVAGPSGVSVPEQVEASFLLDFSKRYTEIFDMEKASGADPERAHARAEAAVRALGAGDVGKYID